MKKFVCLCIVALIVGLCLQIEFLSETLFFQDKTKEISCVAVGDNLIHASVYQSALQQNGTYRFEDIYEYTTDYIQSADLAYINMETICAGTSLGLSHYPRFNGPSEAIDGVVASGFNWLSAASNHSYDKLEKGIVTQLQYTRTHFPQIYMTGLHDSYDDQQQLTIASINGVKVGLLSYTYGLNGGSLPAQKTYLVDLINEEKMKEDMEKLKQNSDIQMVSLHFGNEYQNTPTSKQKEIAQYLSNLGADVIIGTHPHVIQPVEFLTGSEGNQTLVMYSLGNFLSAQDENICMLGGMMYYTVVYHPQSQKVTFKNLSFLPTITHIEDNFSYFRTYTLKDYTNDLANRHTLHIQYSQDMSRSFFINYVQHVIGDEIEIIYE